MSDPNPPLDMSELDQKKRAARIHDFCELLAKIEGVDDKQKQLWREIYENALSDRQNAFAMFVKLSVLSENKSNEHAVHGRTMATYLERMSRANDQLIKLAELITRSDTSSGPIDPNAMFDQIGKRR